MMMRTPAVFLLLWILLLGQGSRAAWWPFSELEEEPAVDSPPPPRVQSRRPLRYYAPLPVKSRLEVLTSSSSAAPTTSSELDCRYALSQSLFTTADSTSTTTTLSCGAAEEQRQVARIATVCHYEASRRHEGLPMHCATDADCTLRMSSEAFGVYSAFLLHAEVICRELASEAWRTAVEAMVESMANAADDALQALDQAREDSLAFQQEHRVAAAALQRDLATVTEQYAEQAKSAAVQLALAQQQLANQTQHLERVQSSLDAVSQLAAKFDSLHGAIAQLQANEWSLANIAERVRFYGGAFVWIRVCGWLLPRRGVSVAAQVVLLLVVLSMELVMASGGHGGSTNATAVWLCRASVLLCGPVTSLASLMGRASIRHRRRGHEDDHKTRKIQAKLLARVKQLKI